MIKAPIILVIVILPVSSSLSSTMHVKASGSRFLTLSSSEIRAVVTGAGEQHSGAYIESIDNNLSLSHLQSANLVQGISIVTAKVVNEGGGNKKPMDFTITSPSSFHGSSAGTPVKLQMGMYSVTESGPPGYNSTLLGDCSGAMMSVETRNCTITNTQHRQ